jgi:hypothetical protein
MWNGFHALRPQQASKAGARGDAAVSNETIQRTWIVGLDTAERVNLLAARLKVSPSPVVDRLLDFALDAAEEGVIAFEARPVRYELV